MEENSQASEEIIVSRGRAIAAFLVCLTSLSWMGAFMLQRTKAAKVMLLIQTTCIVMVGISLLSPSDTHGWFGNVHLLLALFVAVPLWGLVWLWGLILTAAAIVRSLQKDIEEDSQASEEIIVSSSRTIAAFLVCLTSLSWIGAFMLQRTKTAKVMLQIQAACIVISCIFIFGLINISWPFDVIWALLAMSLWGLVWLWGLILTATAYRRALR